MYILKTTELPGFKLGKGRNGPDQVRAYHDSPNEEFVLQVFLNPGTGLSNWWTGHKKGFCGIQAFHSISNLKVVFVDLILKLDYQFQRSGCMNCVFGG